MNTEIILDLRLAVRGLAKAPGFTLVALITLALGIAASATAFRLFYAVLLRPLPYPEPDRIVSLAGRGLSTSRFERWRQSAVSYDLFALAAAAALVPAVKAARVDPIQALRAD